MTRDLFSFFDSTFLLDAATMFGTKQRDPQKRKGRQLEGDEDVLPARKKLHRKAPSEDEEEEDSETPEPAAKSKNQPAPQENNYPSVNDLKKRIRDVKRLLNKPDLPADALVLQQRALAGYEQDLAEEMTRRQRSQMIKKYHFVRFLGMCWCSAMTIIQC